MIPFLDSVIAAAESAGALGAFFERIRFDHLCNHSSLAGASFTSHAGRRKFRWRADNRYVC